MSTQGLPESYKPNEITQRWRPYWEQQGVYKWNPQVPRSNTFAVDTPPPTVSGSLHIGHIFSYTQTDLIVRFQRMMGKNIFYPMGWDDNGLPTERRVQNVFGIQCDIEKPYLPDWKPNREKGKDEPDEKISRKNFIEACSALTLEDEEVYKELFKDIGLSVDWNLEYATINDHCRKTSQLSFLDLVKKGEVYTHEAPTLWDVDFQTAVAQAEVEDRDYAGNYHNIHFQIEGGGDFLIATTRPELLGACIAVVAHPSDERFKPYFGKYAITPLFKAKVPILAAEHADPEKGTGILMVCTFGDTMDIEWWKQSNLPLKQIIGKDGRLLPVTFGKGAFESLDTASAQAAYDQLKGLNTKQAAKKTAELLKATGELEGDLKPTQRPVKFYEKGSRPLEFITSRQWFIKILKHKQALLAQTEKIKWQPDHMKARCINWIEGLNQDWCISRQRYFGVPFPVWYPILENGQIDHEHPIFAEEKQLPVDPMVDLPKGYSEEQRNQKGGFVAEKDVMDTWATSSVSPQICTHWGQDNKRHESLFPMDLRPQSHEIIRTWAFYTIVKAYLHENKIPWKGVGISGWILDPDRKKMSKSKGNVVTPRKYLEDFGGDAIRYWAARARLGVDTAFDEKLFKNGQKLCNKLFNASKFVLGQMGENKPVKHEFDASKITCALDLAWLNRMQKTIERATASYQENDYANALQVIEESFWTFCDHYIEIVKVRAYKGSEAEKASAHEVLDWSLHTFLRLFAPFFPYITEEVWSWRYNTDLKKSVHSTTWPSLQEISVDKSYDEKYLTAAIEVISKVRSAKTLNQKKLRWPVSTIEVRGEENLTSIFAKVAKDVSLSSNAPETGVSIVVVAKKESADQDFFDVIVSLSETDEGQ